MINYREDSENETSTTWDCRGEPDGEVCSNTSKFIGPEVRDFGTGLSVPKRPLEVPFNTNQFCWLELRSLQHQFRCSGAEVNH